MNEQEMIEARANILEGEALSNPSNNHLQPKEYVLSVESKEQATAEYEYWSKAFSHLSTPNREELREKFAQTIGQHTENCEWDIVSPEEKDASYREADFLLALLPEYEEVKRVQELEQCLQEDASDLWRVTNAIKYAIEEIEWQELQELIKEGK